VGGGGSGEFEVGAAVEVRYHGTAKYYPGKIRRSCGHGAYDIAYDDGEKESGVKKLAIRAAGNGDGFAVGTAVEARYRGKATYYPGMISRICGVGTYNIDYDDGETETYVRKDFIVRAGVGKGAFPAGAAIEARYRGKATYYPGKIRRYLGCWLYDVDYDDGEKECGVKQEWIRVVEPSRAAGGVGGEPAKANKPHPAKSGRAEGEKETSSARRESPPQPVVFSAPQFSEGTAVEVQYLGKAKFYSGRITRACVDGSYDIAYDDGEKESGVKGEFIRPKRRAPQRTCGCATFGSHRKSCLGDPNAVPEVQPSSSASDVSAGDVIDDPPSTVVTALPTAIPVTTSAANPDASDDQPSGDRTRRACGCNLLGRHRNACRLFRGGDAAGASTVASGDDDDDRNDVLAESQAATKNGRERLVAVAQRHDAVDDDTAASASSSESAVAGSSTSPEEDSPASLGTCLVENAGAATAVTALIPASSSSEYSPSSHGAFTTLARTVFGRVEREFRRGANP
jgi:hypothetical protein